MSDIAIPAQSKDVSIWTEQDAHEAAQIATIGAATVPAFAKQVRNLAQIEMAVTAVLSAQRNFVMWWDRQPKSRGRLGNGSTRGTILEDFNLAKATVSRWRKKLTIYDEDLKQTVADDEKFEDAVIDEMLRIEKRLIPDGSDITASKHTGDEESYTPAKYIESARLVMGGIDLDPASNPMAQQTVNADTYYTKDDNGLEKEWRGRVWMNPPYTARVINEFIDKMVAHYSAGDIEAGVVLTNNNTDTSWFHNGASVASAVCFTAGRINFEKPSGETSSPTNGQAFFYFGDNVSAFRDEFSKHGMVMVRA